MKRVIIWTLLFLGVAGEGKIFASWIEGGAGGRASGLFGSYTAGGNDIFGIYYNPANLGYVRYWEIGLDYNRLAIGLSDESVLATEFFGMNIPLKRLREIREEKIVSVSSPTIVEVIASSETVSDSSSTVRNFFPLEFKQKIRLYQHIGSIGLAWHSFRLNEEYERNVYYLTYSGPIGEKLVFGLSGKYLQQKYTVDEYLRESPVFAYGQKDSVGNFSGDVGLIYNPWPQIFIGLSGQDLFSPDLGLAGEDRVLPSYRFGFALRSRDIFWELGYLNEAERSYYSSGLEKRWGKVFATRCGLGLGQNNYAGLSGGFSFDFYSAVLEYGFTFPLTGMKNFYGDHRLSFICKFGRWHPADIEKGTLEYSYRELQNELQNCKLQLAESEAEKERLKKVLAEESALRIKEKIESIRKEPNTKIEIISLPPGPAKVQICTHTVQPGETLQSIAKQYLGDARYWIDIYSANKERVGRDGIIHPQQVLIIPMVKEEKAREEKVTPEPVPVASPMEGVAKSTEPVIISTSPAPVEKSLPESKPPAAKPEKKEVKKYELPLKHLVLPGDNLRSLAVKYYNNPERWRDIYEANRNKLIRGNLIPGTEIIIPK